MSSLKYLFFCILLSITGCAYRYAPDEWLPETDKVPEEVYGGWITIFFKSDSAALSSDDADLLLSGEFIAIDSSNIFVLDDSLYSITLRNIEKSILELDQKKSGTYSLWTCTGLLSTFTHGFYSIISAPVWAVTGFSSASGDSYRDRYEMTDPDSVYWSTIQKYARFPQGLPEQKNDKLLPKILFNDDELSQ